MVGGYVILSKIPLVPGINNLAGIYGSIDAINQRIDLLGKIQKPILVEYDTLVDGDHVKASAYFEMLGKNDNTLALKSFVGTIAYDVTTGLAKLMLSHD